MNLTVPVALGGTASLLLALLCALLIGVLSSRRRLRRALDASRAEVDAIGSRVDELSQMVAKGQAARAVPQSERLITDAGVSADAIGAASVDACPSQASGRAVLSVTLGEPLVKAVAFVYGVRRALSPESRNRILFEMRREVKRSRKQRRRDMKGAHRAAQAAGREEVAREELLREEVAREDAA